MELERAEWKLVRRCLRNQSASAFTKWLRKYTIWIAAAMPLAAGAYSSYTARTAYVSSMYGAATFSTIDHPAASDLLWASRMGFDNGMGVGVLGAMAFILFGMGIQTIFFALFVLPRTLRMERLICRSADRLKALGELDLSDVR
jgi:hypothetical protein